MMMPVETNCWDQNLRYNLHDDRKTTNVNVFNTTEYKVDRYTRLYPDKMTQGPSRKGMWE